MLEAQAARIAAFGTVGTLHTTQELIGRVLDAMDMADPELVTEETLCLVAVATARAAEAGLREQPALKQAVGSALQALPFTYRDYLLGSWLLHQTDQHVLEEIGREVYGRLQRKQTFYEAHLPAGQFPGERLLRDKMGLWMGRISPPGLPELPQERMDRLELVPMLHAHVRLVLSFCRQVVAEQQAG
ncbi:hypothetical protein [Rhodothermus profundi]|uniref:Uncharacterized protein n=1 Tax=Rhodothermus profundi TaxID=633813 RepID=A0A1M6USQ8_9BACT|nr:hypothetical protein [Rhodothermus profundi]SHK72267.1 hypothetical protein SAMN04488087_1846 [Rhodothermus profundi]